MNIKELTEEIKMLREALYSIAKKRNHYSGSEIVRKSQELDKLIILYQTLKYEKPL
ncbi:aspartyl-phosphate phosphatase Spo0E family protein [Fictibacillus solisalsi]|uniref:aspartyl-phosphate phosphatase Spo0E family protein n=1 Tax=Fictibacillus solisalsi TaxID=459525 RepID=UPI000B7FD599|nr:aspartyl-phosphate phosphatase Spo0E family protein [Fictibacillus solisalsi]